MDSPLLTITNAQPLLAQFIPEASVVDLQHITNTNDVFRLVTERHGSFYVKFHTAKWYKDAEDTYIVVRREQSAYELLERKGIPLAYRSWSDCTRSIVGRSVLVTSELPGMPLPEALKAFPGEQRQILDAQAGFLRAVHAIELPRAGYIELCRDSGIRHPLEPEGNPWWDSHACQKPENLRAFALPILESKEALLPATLYADLRRHFEEIPARTKADYARPRFVFNNFHPHHFHVQRTGSGWQMTGAYDLEVTSSGNPAMDLALNDLQITPLLAGVGWREAFYESYGGWPAVEAYKSILLSYVLMGLDKTPGEVVPDPAWLIERFPLLLRAERAEELDWYPKVGAT